MEIPPRESSTAIIGITGEVGNVFKAAGIALPANIAEQPAS
jgi:hypothetical protein